MRLSTRNQLTALSFGRHRSVMAVGEGRPDGGQQVTASITKDASPISGSRRAQAISAVKLGVE